MLEDAKADGAVGGGSKEKAKVCKIREFLVKWQGKSYWKCSWVSELRVSRVDSQVYLVTSGNTWGGGGWVGARITYNVHRDSLVPRPYFTAF